MKLYIAADTLIPSFPFDSIPFFMTLISFIVYLVFALLLLFFRIT